MVRRIMPDVGVEGNLLGSISGFQVVVRIIVGCPIAIGEHAVGLNLS